MPNRSLTRRALLKDLALTTAALLSSRKALAQRQYGGSNGQQRGEMGRLAGAFRRQFSVPATSIAISRNGQFAYDEAIGMADRQHLVQAQQDSLFRIASLTKPITSVTIFSLIEQGKLNLTDKVFGPSAILGIRYGKPPFKPYITDITVDHLLTHTAGGWPNDSTDPMMRNDARKSSATTTTPPDAQPKIRASAAAAAPPSICLYPKTAPASRPPSEKSSSASPPTTLTPAAPACSSTASRSPVSTSPNPNPPPNPPPNAKPQTRAQIKPQTRP